MAPNNETGRLDIAEEYLLSYPPDSQEFEAALEHVRWVHDKKPDLRVRCEEILSKVVLCRRDEIRTMKKLRTLA